MDVDSDITQITRQLEDAEHVENTLREIGIIITRVGYELAEAQKENTELRIRNAASIVYLKTMIKSKNKTKKSDPKSKH